MPDGVSGDLGECGGHTSGACGLLAHGRVEEVAKMSDSEIHPIKVYYSVS